MFHLRCVLHICIRRHISVRSPRTELFSVIDVSVYVMWSSFENNFLKTFNSCYLRRLYRNNGVRVGYVKEKRKSDLHV